MKDLELITPKRSMSFIPAHVKSAPKLLITYSSQDFDYKQKFELFACLLHNREESPNDPYLDPANIRAHANLKSGFWTTYDKTKDPTTS